MFEDVLHGDSTCAAHCFVENIIKSLVQAWILEGVYSMDPIKRNSSFKNCIFQLGPINRIRLSMVQVNTSRCYKLVAESGAYKNIELVVKSKNK